MEWLEIFNTAPDVQVCFFGWLMAALGQGAGGAATGGAAGGAAGAAAGGAAGGAAAGGAAGGAAAGGGAIGGGAAAGGTIGSGGAIATMVEAGTQAGQSAAGASTAATPLETFVNVAPETAATTAPTTTPPPTVAQTGPVPVPSPTITPLSQFGGTAPSAPTVTGSGTPAAGTVLPTAFSTQALSPSMITAGGGITTPAGTTPPPAGPGLLERINTFLSETQAPIKSSDKEIVKLAKNVRDIARKAPPKKEAEAGPGGPQSEQAIEPTPPSRIPELSRAETISAPIGLNLAKGEEVPLSFEDIKGLQQSGILELVAQLRTQRRLFG